LLHFEELLEPQLVIEGPGGFQVGHPEGEMSDPALIGGLRQA
jgi:hypothetical protein